MKTWYVLLLLVLVACNPNTGESTLTAKNPSDGSQIEPTPTPWQFQDHSSRLSNPYGTPATATECNYMVNWHVGINETWMFGQAWHPDYIYQNQEYFARFDKDGVVWRDKLANGTWHSIAITDEVLNLGQYCQIYVKEISGVPVIQWVKWNGSLL